jgi:hypothetical protein
VEAQVNARELPTGTVVASDEQAWVKTKSRHIYPWALTGSARYVPDHHIDSMILLKIARVLRVGRT